MLRNYLPKFILKYLFGDRDKYGSDIIEKDIEWLKFQDYYYQFNKSLKSDIVLRYIDNLGYSVLKKINLNDKTLLEFGAGLMPHQRFWKGNPKKYIVVDVNKQFLKLAKSKFKKKCKTIYLKGRNNLPNIKNNSVDIIFSFYSLEHIKNIDEYLLFFETRLKKGGLLVGAIPNEGGIAWGLGRLLTTYRRMVKKGFNYNKIICWEHVHTCDKIIKKIKQTKLSKVTIKKRPFGSLGFYDFNLVTTFIFKKK